MLLNLKAISKIELIWDGCNHDLFVRRRISWRTSPFRPLVPQYLCYSVKSWENFSASIPINTFGNTSVRIGATGFQHLVHEAHLHGRQRIFGISNSSCINNWLGNWEPITIRFTSLMVFPSRSVVLFEPIAVKCFAVLPRMDIVQPKMKSIKVFTVT